MHWLGPPEDGPAPHDRGSHPAARAPPAGGGCGNGPVRLPLVVRPTAFVKRLLIGRPFRSDRMQHTLLPKRIALPVFASDALSSVAYAPDEILLTLAVGGAAFYAYSPWIALGVVVVMLTVVASYRQNVHAYPSGGGDYEVATVNLGPRFGLVVASALMVDYVLTVAVSVSSGVANLGSAWSFAQRHPVTVAVIIVAVLTAMNLRGVREAGTAFAIPTYAFMVAVIGMVGWGLVRIFVLGNHLEAESASMAVTAGRGITGFSFAFLMVRAFSSGSAALTGVEAISNGVPAFRKPKSRNAATTLLLLGSIAITMLVGIITLSRLTHVKIFGTGQPEPVIPQLARVVFGGFLPAFYFTIATTALILVLAANTAFNGFPVLGSILAQDRYL
ncbi:MAG: APC family permease, partial [Micromonosporaceae bacterium]|nr:APC family permease [Micromonosporaceae bacterium]